MGEQKFVAKLIDTIEEPLYDLLEASRILHAAHKAFFDLLATNLEFEKIEGNLRYEYADTLLHLHDAGFIKLKKKDEARLLAEEEEEEKPEQETLRRIMRRAWFALAPYEMTRPSPRGSSLLGDTISSRLLATSSQRLPGPAKYAVRSCRTSQGPFSAM